jgi:ADP-ribose pyrophosphatase
VEVRDTPITAPITSSQTVFHGRVWDIVAEDAELRPGVVVRREFMKHPGAVAILAVDSEDRILLQRQYRHPVRARLWEPPAGLLDKPGEAPIEAAKRELMEEADLEAGDWRSVLWFYSTPGGTDEVIHVFLARDLRPVPEDRRFAREDEEATLVPEWVKLDDAGALVLSGAIHSPTAVTGVLALLAARNAPGGWDSLPIA